MDETNRTHKKDPNERSDSNPAVDKTRIDYLRDLMEDAFVDLIDRYLKNVPEQIKALKAAVQNGDLHPVFRIAHSIKSSSAHIGANKLSELCRALEAEGCIGKISRIEQEFQRVRTILELERQTLKQ